MTDTTLHADLDGQGEEPGPVLNLDPAGTRQEEPPPEKPVTEVAPVARVVLSKADILGADDRPVEEVEVPEWGGIVYVRGMTGAQRDEYFASQSQQRGRRLVQDISNATAKIVARCIVMPDDHTQRMFTDQEVAKLGERSSAALEKVGAVAARLSGLTEEDMEELGKDSGSTPSEDSTSG